MPQSSDHAAPQAFEPSTLIKGRFLLKQYIGRGDMGVVFAAVDNRKNAVGDTNPWVAIKLLNNQFAQHAKALMVLQREARKAQELTHPNVATVFDFDREGDVLFITMEWVEGRSLDALMRETHGKGMAREIALPIIRGIATGLAYAHRKGIVHANLKPSNVIVDHHGIPKILDFGIARAMQSNLADQSDLNIASQTSEADDAYAADDVYALGVIAYELLTGTHPYQGLGLSEARQRGLKPTRTNGLTEGVKEGLNDREWSVIERCLAFERSRRPRDAAIFLKQFFSVTRARHALVAAATLLVLTTGYVACHYYHQASQARPSLSAAPLQIGK